MVTSKFFPFIFSVFILIIVSAVATTVTVQPAAFQQDVGSVHVIYFEDANLAGAKPATNTETAQPSGAGPGSSGQTTVNPGTSATMWSPKFPARTHLPPQTLMVDFWAVTGNGGPAPPGPGATVVVYFNITASNGRLVYSAGSVAVTLTGAKAQYEVTLKLTATKSIPRNGHLAVTFSVPKTGGGPAGGNPATVYWGVNQLTNFQINEYEEVTA